MNLLRVMHFINFRSFVRLAEHDKRTDKDTKHEDVKVTKIESHKHFDGLTNDIALLYLEKDVTFRGESKKKSSQISIKMSILLFFIAEFHRSHQAHLCAIPGTYSKSSIH